MILNKTKTQIFKTVSFLLFKYVSILLCTFIGAIAAIQTTNQLVKNANGIVGVDKDVASNQVSSKESIIDSRMAALTANINKYVINQAKVRDDIESATRDIFKWPVEAKKDYMYELFQYKKTNTEINFMRFSKSENYFSKELCLKYNTSGFCEDNGFNNPDKLRMENDIEFYTSVITAGDIGKNLVLINNDIAREKYHSSTGIISHEKILEIFDLPDMN
ncbi:hypothetical protein [Pseudomonas sp. HY7a-MNA-CIBAN-0227]|uniref:hypothetical protein n=1 Tax=Pseudomonas sp. HY7a-MNA-CIBAN-0227 TaxID=3140474 RepID=UPI003324B3B1